MTTRPRSVEFSVKDVLPIVNDASIAGPVAEGLNIPLVIVDTAERPDVPELIRLHAHLSAGDVTTTWGGVQGKPDEVLLILDFERPVETRVILRFSIEQRGGLVDMAVTAGAIYLQAGKPGDRLLHDIDHPKVLIELPDTGFRPIWEGIFLDGMTAAFSRSQGLPRRKARPYAREFIAEWRRTLGSFRMPPPRSN